LRGRASDVINVAGRKVAPARIEQALNRHPSVAASLVFGVPGRETGRGDTIVACVVSRKPVKADKLRQFLLTDLDAWQLPREWWFVDSLETNQRGKISRADWRQKFLDRV
jgi:acyl-CoA synthetase (AMP-forming)/AMP-acid ligase II